MGKFSIPKNDDDVIDLINAARVNLRLYEEDFTRGLDQSGYLLDFAIGQLKDARKIHRKNTTEPETKKITGKIQQS